MNELEFQEEWLSAYLDDELTEEQRQVVEHRLAVDPVAQATLDDLQRVRAMVAKLPSWSGPVLKFAIPSELPGSFDEVEDEFDNDSDDELEDFEEVPRSLVAVEEPRVTTASANWNSNSLATRSMLIWIATAASVLLVAGLGYRYSYLASSGFTLALNSKPAGAESDNPLSSTPKLDRAGGLVSGLGRTENHLGDALNREQEFNSPNEGEGKDARRLGENVDLLAKQYRLEMQPDSIAPALEAADMKAVSPSTPDSSIPGSSPPASSLGLLPAGRGGFGGGGARGLAMGNLPADAAVADLPPPGPLSEALSMGRPENTRGALADDYSTKEEASTAPAVYFARSQTWMDEEAQTSLQYGDYSANQLGLGTNAPQAGGDQDFREVTTESVLMAAIKPEIANSPEFFQNMISANQLTAVDQQRAQTQWKEDNRFQTGSAGATARFETANEASVTRANESTNAPSQLFLGRGIRIVVPHAPQGNSFVLFVNRDEANRILNELQEKGQVSSQVWRVVKQAETRAETQDASGKVLNMPAVAEPLNSVEDRVAGEALSRKPEPTGSDKVILLLNGPPN